MREGNKRIAYSRLGEFKNIEFDPAKKYTILAYDRRLNSVIASVDNPATPEDESKDNTGNKTQRLSNTGFNAGYSAPCS